jgi:predicted DNA-binding transcriptional regulator AlpA
MPNQISNNRAVLPYSSNVLIEQLEGTVPHQISNNRIGLTHSSHVLNEPLEGTMSNQTHKTNSNQSNVIYLKRQELEARYQVTKTTIYSWIKTRGFPAPIHFGANLVRWNSVQVIAWENEKEVV